MVPLGLPMVPFVPTFPPMVTLALMVPLAAEKRSGLSGYRTHERRNPERTQYYRQSTVWAKLPTLESHMIQYGVLNSKFINFTNKHCSGWTGGTRSPLPAPSIPTFRPLIPHVPPFSPSFPTPIAKNPAHS